MTETALSAYSDDQPRDEQGRWASGGAGEKLSKEGKAHVNNPQAQSHAERSRSDVMQHAISKGLSNKDVETAGAVAHKAALHTYANELARSGRHDEARSKADKATAKVKENVDKRASQAKSSAAESMILRCSAANPLSMRIVGASEKLELEAIAATGDKPAMKRFKMTAYTGAPMQVGYGLPVVVDLQGMAVPHQRIPILRDHDHTQIVAHADTIEKSPQRLRIQGVMSGVGPAAAEVMALAQNDFPWQASIGASVQKMEKVEQGESVTVNGRAFDGPLYVARQTQLGETSFVAMGADCHTSADVMGRRQETVETVILAFTHNSITAPGEPDWAGVDKTKLPDMAFADRPDRSFPHHWVKGGGEPDDKGRDTTGTLYLHKGGLNAAWAAANGARSGQKASQAVIDHLQAHRRALGIKD